ncbi:MAG: transketolase [Candidatus Omnitrophica bacterium]|nr:transketolase [Candidatus Omnitrophota bacterium]
MRNAYLSALYDLAKKDSRILALISDNGTIVYDKYRADLADQFLNCGISEANMISVAAGLASCGKIPFTYTITNFLIYRAYEQIRNDACLQKMNVKFVGIGCGFAYSNLGPTHHATEDIALMRVLPNMTILSPCDPWEARKLTVAAAEIDGPVFLRLATGGTPKIYDEGYGFKVGQGVTILDGEDVTIIATGGIVFEVLKAVEELKKKGISARVINLHTIKPIDKEIILKAAQETRTILIVEEHSIVGGLGSAVSEILQEEGKVLIRFKRMGLNNAFPQGYGSHDDMKEMNGLSKGHICQAVETLLKEKEDVFNTSHT